MSETTDELKAELARLPVPQRAELARFLIDSLDQGEDADAEEAWDEELARRAEEIKNGMATGEPADDVMAELREKHS
jgi:putative addiction module component (TIGR02574 family)